MVPPLLPPCEQAYAARLMKYCSCSPVCFVAAYAYLLRLAGAAARGSPAGVAITPRTAHRLLITGEAQGSLAVGWLVLRCVCQMSLHDSVV